MNPFEAYAQRYAAMLDHEVRGEQAEADQIRDELDPLWFALSDADMERFNSLAADPAEPYRQVTPYERFVRGYALVLDHETRGDAQAADEVRDGLDRVWFLLSRSEKDRFRNDIRKEVAPYRTT